MSRQNKIKFSQLVERYINGDATPEEILWIENYYGLFREVPDHTDQLTPVELAAMQHRMKQNIMRDVSRKRHPLYRIHQSYYLRWAAAVLLLVGLVTALVYQYTPLSPTLNASNNTSKVKQVSATGKNRFIRLPDGSKVVLHGDSKIVYDKTFNTTTRTIQLIGEAYFDVVHLQPNSQKQPVPFIIQTGNVTTTVLGTAFTVRALPDEKEVIVTVSRGKVKVENERRQSTFLTANKQVTFRLDEPVDAPKTVNPAETTAWLHADMVFDEMPYGVLAENLEKRYGITIAFENPALKDCLITGRFSGTESLNDVFKLLALTSRTKYTITSDKVMISGTSCF